MDAIQAFLRDLLDYLIELGRQFWKALAGGALVVVGANAYQLATAHALSRPSIIAVFLGAFVAASFAAFRAQRRRSPLEIRLNEIAWGPGVVVARTTITNRGSEDITLSNDWTLDMRRPWQQWWKRRKPKVLEGLNGAGPLTRFKGDLTDVVPARSRIDLQANFNVAAWLPSEADRQRSSYVVTARDSVGVEICTRRRFPPPPDSDD
jgi:hypothetical protein